MSLSLVCWKWNRAGYRSTFTGEHVNRLAMMARRWYRRDLRVICVTDDPTGIDMSVDVLSDWADFADVASPHGGNNPSCYRRLRGFHPAIAEHFGPRFVSIDLDVVITGDVSELWDRDEEFVGLRDPYYGRQLNGSMWQLQAGARPHVWNRFDPVRSPIVTKLAGYRGSDQAWLSYCLPDAPRWSTADGVYSYRKDIEPLGGKLPAGARIVSLHGATDPWSPRAQALPWIREHWGEADERPTIP